MIRENTHIVEELGRGLGLGTGLALGGRGGLGLGRGASFATFAVGLGGRGGGGGAASRVLRDRIRDLSVGHGDAIEALVEGVNVGRGPLIVRGGRRVDDLDGLGDAGGLDEERLLALGVAVKTDNVPELLRNGVEEEAPGRMSGRNRGSEGESTDWSLVRLTFCPCASIMRPKCLTGMGRKFICSKCQKHQIGEKEWERTVCK